MHKLNTARALCATDRKRDAEKLDAHHVVNRQQQSLEGRATQVT